MEKAELKNLRDLYSRGLLDDVLPFWVKHSVDRERGGFQTMLDRRGELLDDDKSVWAQCRFTWLLATLYREMGPRPEWKELALHGIEFIEEHCFDADGRMFFHLTREGLPLRKRRYAFTDGFGAMAFAAVAAITERGDYAARAVKCFETFLRHAPDPKFTDVRPAKSIGKPMLTVGVVQVLRETIDYPQANELIDRAIDEIQTDFVKPDQRAVMEQVAPDGSIIGHFDGRTLNPGHAIEAAWFIMQEGRVRENPEYIRLGTRMLDWSWERGWDPEYGGIFYFRDLHGQPVQDYWHDMKFWWPHNEAIIATLLASFMTGNEKYARWHRLVHDWAYAHFPDPEYGEWFGYLHRDGTVSTDLKGNLWKGPFHVPRMQLFCRRLIDDFLAGEFREQQATQ